MRRPLFIRRFMCAALFTALATVPLGTMAQSDSDNGPVTLRVGDSIDPLPLIGAIDKGYFAKQNITVQLVRLPSAPNHIAATIGGSEDLFYGDVLAWASAVGNGLKLQLLQAVNEGDAAPSGGQLTILVRPNGGITSAADLKGKTIGVLPTPLIALSTKLWLKRNGVDPAIVKFTPVSPDLALAPALLGGHVDAVVSDDPYTEQSIHDNGLVALGYPSRETPPGTTQAAVYASTAWLTAHPGVAKRFAIAIRQGSRWANSASPEEKATVLAKFTPVDLAALETKVPGIVKEFHYFHWLDGAVDVAKTQHWVTLAYQNGLIDKDVQIKDALYAPTALQANLK